MSWVLSEIDKLGLHKQVYIYFTFLTVTSLMAGPLLCHSVVFRSIQKADLNVRLSTKVFPY